MQALSIRPIKTRIFHGHENLVDFIWDEVPLESWQEGVILAITSKIISLHEGRLVSPNNVNKLELIKKEADHYLGEIGFGCHLTIKQAQLIATAGIDESNSEQGDFILYPLDPYVSARSLREGLMGKLALQNVKLKNLGILVTDSQTKPLRHGVVGSCVSFAGFHPVKSCVGDLDIFKRPLKMTKQNFADGLAAAAVITMGEADECCPLALIIGAKVEFADFAAASELEVPVTEDMYFPLYKNLIPRD